MKAFWTYTLARLAVFGVCLVVVWFALPIWFERTELVNIFALLVAMVISSIISVFLLSGLRDNLAQNVHDRATRMTERLEESRRAEDVD
jgi:mannitol-specific phosphotransferase system IIBC component